VNLPNWAENSESLGNQERLAPRTEGDTHGGEDLNIEGGTNSVGRGMAGAGAATGSTTAEVGSGLTGLHIAGGPAMLPP
jgi:hypothetical protein